MHREARLQVQARMVLTGPCKTGLRQLRRVRASAAR